MVQESEAVSKPARETIVLELVKSRAIQVVTMKELGTPMSGLAYVAFTLLKPEFCCRLVEYFMEGMIPRDLWVTLSPRFSDFAKTKIEPAMDEGSRMDQTSTHDPSVRPQLQTSRYPYVCGIILSETEGVEGGETILRGKYGKLKKIGPLPIGTGFVLRGDHIAHQVMPFTSPEKMFTAVAPFQIHSPSEIDETHLGTSQPFFKKLPIVDFVKLMLDMICDIDTGFERDPAAAAANITQLLRRTAAELRDSDPTQAVRDVVEAAKQQRSKIELSLNPAIMGFFAEAINTMDNAIDGFTKQTVGVYEVSSGGRQHVIRQAVPGDLRRVGLVVMLGFSSSPVFKYERPRYLDYPGDTYYDYCLQIVDHFLNPNTRIYVSEDSYAPDEEGHVPKNFPKQFFCPATGDKVIASVAICSGLRPREIPRAEQEYFEMIKASTYSQRRDKDLTAAAFYKLETKGAKERVFAGCPAKIEVLATDPSYRFRDHAKALGSICVNAVKKEKKRTGVSATPMSHKIFQGLGFEMEELKSLLPFSMYLGKLPLPA